MGKQSPLIPIERIENTILVVRGEKVILDAVRRNQDRFPQDFMFRLTKEEFEILRRHFGTSKKWGGRRYPPYAFTEQGVAMLSGILRSKRAVQVNIEIMRAFVLMRRMLTERDEMLKRVESLERKYDKQFKIIFDALKKLMEPPDKKSKTPMGFYVKK